MFWLAQANEPLSPRLQSRVVDFASALMSASIFFSSSESSRFSSISGR
ncbi:hypothetical protein LA2_07270 [Lactobacillus amylovorus GRL 1112]|uniref:Uncharacterized protein n=1 Tax=Lactobacillus amylovorus (strain GRL 1112) TaxID=695560 RepID=E4SKA2_LACAR|nr:hypothetical protein LA2_07270 [Lactobacillus amylovorus GRL 1112]